MHSAIHFAALRNYHAFYIIKRRLMPFKLSKPGNKKREDEGKVGEREKCKREAEEFYVCFIAKRRKLKKFILQRTWKLSVMRNAEVVLSAYTKYAEKNGFLMKDGARAGISFPCQRCLEICFIKFLERWRREKEALNDMQTSHLTFRLFAAG